MKFVLAGDWLRCGRVAAMGTFLVLSSAMAVSPTDTYYVNDGLATTLQKIDAAAEISSIEADAFGSSAGQQQTAFFTGKPYDQEMGAHVFPFRNYRAEEARWMSADPSGFPDGFNGRVYAPLPNREIDPLGLWTIFSSPAVPGDIAWAFTGYYDQMHNSQGNPTTRRVGQVRYDFGPEWVEFSGIGTSVGKNTALDYTVTTGLSSTTEVSIGGSAVGVTVGASVSTSGSVEQSLHVSQPASPDHGWRVTTLAAFVNIYTRYSVEQYNASTGAWATMQSWNNNGNGSLSGSGYLDRAVRIYE